MFALIRKLKTKPADVKNRIALFAAMSLTAIIVGIWLLALRQGGADDPSGTSAKESLRPLMMIFGGAKDGFGDIRTNINSTKE